MGDHGTVKIGCMLAALIVQGVQIDVDEGRLRIRVELPKEGDYDEVSETDTYVLYRRKTGRTRLIVPYPAGATIGVYSTDDHRLVFSGKVPIVKDMRPGKYDISISYRDYVWNATLEVRWGMENVLYVKYMDRKEEQTEEREEHEDYLIVRRPSEKTYLRIKEPEGCSCEVLDESGHLIHKAKTPTGKYLKAGFYIVRLTCGRKRWEGKVEVKYRMENTLYVKVLKEEQREPMTAEAFARLLKALDDASFSDEKYAIVKEAASKNYFTSGQVLKILRKFDFEEDKLKVAKLLYPRVVDPENFFVVYEAFDFSSSKEELRKWVEKYDRTHGRDSK